MEIIRTFATTTPVTCSPWGTRRKDSRLAYASSMVSYASSILPTLKRLAQAGRYMPSFREYSEKYSFRERSETPEIATILSLQPWKRFGVDGVIMFSGMYDIWICIS